MSTTKPANSRDQSVGELIARTAEAMTLSSDPEKRAAAERWLKIIERQLARLTKKAA